ncbi:MAG: DMT family transporter [Rickettsiales bacterium]
MPPIAILSAILVAVCWGANFSAAHLAMQEFPPLLTVLLRFVGISVLLAPFALTRPWPRLRDALVISFLLVSLQFGLLFTALSMGLSITSTIIATQLGVPFSCVFAAIVFKDYLGPWRAGGLAVAFVGVIVVAGTPNAASHGLAFALAMAAALSWSCANLYMKRAPKIATVPFLFWTSLFAVPPLLALSLLIEHPTVELLASAHAHTWAAIAYSLIFSSVIGYGLWNYLISHYPVSQVVPYSLLVPVAGIAVGALMFADEPVGTRSLIGGALTIVGVAVISFRRPGLAVEAEKQ